MCLQVVHELFLKAVIMNHLFTLIHTFLCQWCGRILSGPNINDFKQKQQLGYEFSYDSIPSDCSVHRVSVKDATCYWEFYPTETGSCLCICAPDSVEESRDLSEDFSRCLLIKHWSTFIAAIPQQPTNHSDQLFH